MSLWMSGVLLARALALGAEAEPPEVETQARVEILDLQIREGDGQTLVSFRVGGALSADAVGRLESGIPITFRHRVELVARRVVPLIPAKTLSRVEVSTTARYDSLTHQYYLHRKVEGETDGEPEVPTEAEAATPSEAEMEGWMTKIDASLPMPPEDVRGDRLRIRVRSVVGRRYRLLIFPTSEDAEAERSWAP